MNMYEFNQAGYNSLPKMSKSAIENAQIKITKWLVDMDEALPSIENIYLMLLNHESHYYTIFNWLASDLGTSSPAEKVAAEIFSIAKSLGTLKAIEHNDNGAWEFWITGPDAVTRMYALFNYTGGVIEL